MKFIHLARIYLGDIELYELMSPKNIAPRHLLARLRNRGLIYSDEGKESDIRSRVAFLPSDLKFVTHILNKMERPDPVERKTSQRIQNCNEGQNLQDAVKKIEDERSTKYGETYNIVRNSENGLVVEVSYTELNYSLAVPYQRRLRKLFVEVKQDGNKVVMRYTANDKGTHIAEGIKSAITYQVKNTPEITSISLRGVRDPAERTRFFTELTTGIKGFRYVNATYLSVDRRFPADESNETDDDLESSEIEDTKDVEKESSKKELQMAKELKGMINRVSFLGDQVLITDLYQKARESGYYISNIKWTVVSRADERFHLDCEAGLNDPVEGEPFACGISRVWRYKNDDPSQDETVPLSSGEMSNFEDLLDDSSYAAFAKIIPVTTTE